MRSRKSRNTANTTPGYVGRFAPSPTGPLHLGSLICALASFLDARSHGGRWLMRMEDLDPPREQAGAAESLLESLRAHGLHWDGPVLWQSQRHPAYAEIVERLLHDGEAFRCDCSRARLKALGDVYPGYCRERALAADAPTAIRLRVEGDSRVTISDRIQPSLVQEVGSEVGDFIIRRRDQLYAYQLAVVVDDEYQGITHVVRGSDLYDSTPRQVYLQQRLGYLTPSYAHIPVITNSAGQKLSKQTHAAPIDDGNALDNLRLALAFLRQRSPGPGCSTPDRLLQAAIEHWQPRDIPAVQGIPETTLY